MAAGPESLAAQGERLPPHRYTAAEAVAELGSDARQGLTAGEACVRLSRHGRNELPSEPPAPVWRRFLAQFRDVLTILLLARPWSPSSPGGSSATPRPLRGADHPRHRAPERLAWASSQESRAERARGGARAMAAPTRPRAPGRGAAARPDRGARAGRHPPARGGRHPRGRRPGAASISLRAAEAALTGESTPVSKDSAALVDEAAGSQTRSNMVFSGTAVAAGRGRAVVTATGPATEIGRIAGSLRTTQEVQTPLQRELDRVGKLLGAAVIAIAVGDGGRHPRRWSTSGRCPISWPCCCWRSPWPSPRCRRASPPSPPSCCRSGPAAWPGATSSSASCPRSRRSGRPRRSAPTRPGR